MAPSLPANLIRTPVRQLGGVQAQKGDLLFVRYRGSLKNGTVFDSNIDPSSQLFRFELGAGQVISGWDQGLEGVAVGDVVTLEIPAALAYGERSTSSIPANSDLVFEVSVWAVVRGSEQHFLTTTLFGIPPEASQRYLASHQPTEQPVLGLDSNEQLSIGPGGGYLFGAGGVDQLNGGIAADLIAGGAGNDTITGLGGHDVVLGNTGDDVILGGAGDDWCHGGQGTDQLNGGGGDDWLSGGMGDDQLRGGNGADTFALSRGRDRILDFNSKQGDRISFAASQPYRLQTAGDNLNLIREVEGLQVVTTLVGVNAGSFDPALSLLLV